MSLIPFGFWDDSGIIQNGLVLYVDSGKADSYPGSGSTWSDLSTSNLDGTLTNGPTFNSGNGGSFIFDGVDDYVAFGDVLDLGINDMTAQSWIKLDTVTSAANRQILTKTRAADQNYRFQFQINTAGNVRAFFQGNTGPGTDVTPNGTTVLNANQWYFITAVYKRNGSISFYVNDVLETLSGSAVISQWDGLDFQSNNPFRVGSATQSDNTSLLGLFDGNISMVMLYHRALTQSEITDNFNSTKSRFGL